MKKIILFLLVFLFPNVILAQQTTVEHVSKDANFRIQTFTPWSQMSISKKVLDKSPGWVVRFYKTGEAPDASPLGLLVVDSRKNPDLKQTSEDFANGHAKFLLFQIVEAEKMNPSNPGLVIKESEIKQFNKRDYIYLKYENENRTLTIYRIMTAFNNYTYSINCQITSNDWDNEAAIVANLELMMKTLSAY